MDWQEDCEKFLNRFQKNVSPIAGKQIIDQERSCAVGIQYPEFQDYAKKRGCETQLGYSIEYIPEKRTIWGEILVPNCSAEQKDWHQPFLLTPGVDLMSNSCKIEQVHIHDGPCPSTHIHVHCEIPPDKPMSVAQHSFMWLTEKLGYFVRATCAGEREVIPDKYSS